MANAGGLLVVLIAGLVGLGLVVGTVALLAYGLVARDARRGFTASLVALGFAVVAALLSTPFWIVVLSGRDTHGERLNYGESVPLVAVVAVETLAIAASLGGVLRQMRRRGLIKSD
ncbi:MAG TPA: hypothetical protein VNW92_12675 [Polyangiaceae bacterium]|jgi:hypothetical protein|nr:hypothetical protein [Polyangiaceae bacterium]